MNAPILNQPELIAFCGLYCPACSRFTNGKCEGCAKNEKATWCKIRSCNLEHSYASCADCSEFDNPSDCRKFNNPVSKIFALVFRSDRNASIKLIKEIGYPAYASQMSEKGLMVIKKGKKA